MKSESEFLQGYACAVATLITMRGHADTEVRELFSAGFGDRCIAELRRLGIDEETDIAVFIKHWGELH